MHGRYRETVPLIVFLLLVYFFDTSHSLVLIKALTLYFFPAARWQSCVLFFSQILGFPVDPAVDSGAGAAAPLPARA
jgi:hypothetical protein